MAKQLKAKRKPYVTSVSRELRHGEVAPPAVISMQRWMRTNRVPLLTLYDSFCAWRAPNPTPGPTTWTRLSLGDHSIHPDFLTALESWKREYVAAHEIQLPLPEPMRTTIQPMETAEEWSLGTHELLRSITTEPSKADYTLRTALIAYRKKAGLTVKQLAAKFDVAGSSLGRLEQAYLHDQEQETWGGWVVRDAAVANKMLRLLTNALNAEKPVAPAASVAQPHAKAAGPALAVQSTQEQVNVAVLAIVRNHLSNNLLQEDMVARFAAMSTQLSDMVTKLSSVHEYATSELINAFKEIKALRREGNELRAQVDKLKAQVNELMSIVTAPKPRLVPSPPPAGLNLGGLPAVAAPHGPDPLVGLSGNKPPNGAA